MDAILAALQRIEFRLDVLTSRFDILIATLEALSEDDDEDEPELTLDGSPAGGKREEGTSL